MKKSFANYLSVLVEDLFFSPEDQVYWSPEHAGLNGQKLPTLSDEGTVLRLTKPNIEAKGSVIYFHDGSKNLTTHIPETAWLCELGLEVYLFDIRESEDVLVSAVQKQGSPVRAATTFKCSSSQICRNVLNEPIMPALLASSSGTAQKRILTARVGSSAHSSMEAKNSARPAFISILPRPNSQLPLSRSFRAVSSRGCSRSASV